MFRRSTRTAPTGDAAGPITIRPSTNDDAQALAQLAAVESRELPAGQLLLAEVEGRVVAAAPLDARSAPLADPFRPTAEIVELLKLRTRHISAVHELRRAA